MAKNKIEILIQAKDKASAKLKAVEVSTRALRNGLVLAGKAIAAAGAAMGAIAIKAGAVGDQFDKMSQRVATSAKDLSQLAFAVKQSGGSIEQLEGGLRVLNRNMSETAKGTGAAKDFFKALGIEVKGADGKLRSNVDVMKEVADTISNMTDRTQAAALASRILGEEYGARLVPLLNNGSKGIENLMNQADDLGLTITKDSALIGAGFTDALGEATGATSGLFNTIGFKLIPIIEPMIDAFTMAISKTTKWVEENETLGKTIEGIGKFLGFLNDPLADFKGSLKEMSDAKVSSELLSVNESLKKINETRTKGGGFANKEDAISYKLMAERQPLLAAELKLRKELVGEDERKAAIAERIKKIQDSLLEGNKESSKAVKKAGAEEVEVEDKGLKRRQEIAAQKRRIAQENADFALELAEQEDAEDDERAEKSKEKAMAREASITDFKKNSLGQISQAISAFGGENSTAARAFASGQVVVNTASAIMKGFADLGPIWGAVNAVTMSALGAAQIAKISGAKFHEGGLVPGAGDSPAILEGGEFVMRREAVQNIGSENLAQMNQGKSANVNVVNFVDSDALDNYLNSHKGQKAIVNALEFA